MSERLKTAGAIALGLALASLPFVMFGMGGHSHASGPHMDHAARHGGQLGMVGDSHMELVRKDGRLSLYVSDALRRPLTPVRGTLQFGDGEPAPMQHERFCLSGSDNRAAEDVTCTVWLEDGTRLELTFGLDPADTASQAS